MTRSCEPWSAPCPSWSASPRPWPPADPIDPLLGWPACRPNPTGRSVQERLYPTLTCYGCGPANPDGLQLRSYLDERGAVVASFLPWPQHDNGVGYLNGGIISMLLDCHSAAVALTEADRRGWSGIDGAALPYVTAGLDVRFLRPSPLYEPAQLRGEIVTASADEIVADVALWWQDKPRAQARARWRRWRPRP